MYEFIENCFWNINASSLKIRIYESRGICVVDLDPEEILDSVIEMEERIRGSWLSTGLDVEPDLNYREITRLSPEYDVNYNFVHPESRLGSTFLRKN